MSPTLGDSFPESIKEDFSASVIKVGTVIKCFVTDTNPPKYKRFVVIGVSFDKVAIGCIYINSELNENVNYTDELKALQLPFAAIGREYLDEPSFIDCARIYEKKLEDLKQVIKNDVKCHLGYVSTVDFKSIRDKIKSSRNISPATKKKFGVFL